MSSELILSEKKGHVLHIIINRPEERNAFNVDMLYALSRHTINWKPIRIFESDLFMQTENISRWVWT
ncbi:hypothetical protein LEP1GSC038_2851 [Leptospira weilii str. 2006001855]|uniref:Enoyl-CoA hydratase/isomerase domain protein n=1 Tax=Leptospira weilii str. 2006001855 TaxID=996804 RepID=M6FR49_9LEPT|nr:hypothetical protein LEP1GSC038_2851 [Leptospira weilii str. 2006001855]